MTLLKDTKIWVVNKCKIFSIEVDFAALKMLTLSIEPVCKNDGDKKWTKIVSFYNPAINWSSDSILIIQ